MQAHPHMNGESPSNGTIPAGFKEDNALDLRKIFDRLIINWYWFLICMVLGVAIAWIYLRYATPGYNITAKILVQDDKKGGRTSAEEALEQLELFSTTSTVDNEVEILKSRSLMEKVVKDLQLNVTYWVEGRIKKQEQFNTMPFTFRWISLKDSLKAASYNLKPLGENKFLLTREDLKKEAVWGDTLHLPEGVMYVKRNYTFPLDENGYLINVLSIDQTVAVYQKIFQVNIPNKQVTTIDLMLTSAIPAKGEKILNKLIETYLRASVDDKNRIADSTIDFVDKRLALVGTELMGVEKNIQHFKESNDLADLDAQSQMLLSGTSDYSKQLTEQQVRLSVIESLAQYILDEKNNKRIVPSSLLVQDPTFTGLVEKYNALQLERERLLMTSTESNPVIKNIDQQLAGLRSDIESNLGSMKQGMTVSINELQQKANSLSQQIRRVPAKERVFLDYSRQQAIKQELYLFLLKKREESAISKSSNLAIARVIDPAKSDANPFRPNRMLIYMIGLLAGIGIPSLWLYLGGLLNTRVLQKSDITDQTPVPVLGEIGHIEERGILVVKKNVVTPVVEQFRAIRTNLQFILSGDQKVILLTSSMSGEGKSFVASNLAAVLALSGKKVVLMEMDLRKPNISQKLGIKNDIGFSTYVIGKSSIEEVIKPTVIHDNCWLIPSGPVPPNPAELLLQDQVQILFTRLRKQFDYVIIDTAPIGLVTDAQLLAKWADTTLYLVRQGYTFKQQLQISKDLYLNKKMPRMNLIVNDIKVQGGYGYGYGYGQGYGYGYTHVNGKTTILSRIKGSLARK